MPVSINKVGLKYAKSLISRGKVDRDSAWTFSHEDSAKLLGADGEDWQHLNKFHLAVNTDALEDTVEFQAYPFGKAGKVYRKALEASLAVAKDKGDTEVVSEIDGLLSMLGEAPVANPVQKVSRGDYYDYREWQTEKMERSQDGLRLVGRSVITNVGVFRYPQPDGSEWLELRHPDDVFEEESLASLNGLPLTNDHPTTGVVPENYKHLTVGSVFSPEHDAYHVTAGLAINDKQAMSDVQMGKRALSCGYDCELVPYTDGYLGMPTTHRQKRIRYNHVSLVDMGRAGPAAKLRMDSVVDHSTNPDKGKSMKKIRLDRSAGGAEADVDDLVAVEIGVLKTEIDTVGKSLEDTKKELSAKQAALDTAEGKLAALEATKASLEAKLAGALNADAIEGLVQARVALIDTAKGYGIKVEDSWTARKIREAVVGMAYPSISLDGKSEEFLDGLFDGAKIALTGRTSPNPANTDGGNSHDSTNLDAMLNEARKASASTIQSAWKTKE